MHFADDFVRISGTPEGLQKKIETATAVEYTRKWRVTVNPKKVRSSYV